jgi:DNA-binding PadR family transcriptional regulator
MAPHARPTPLGLAVLSLLEVGPLHPYGMQRLIKLWGKDQVVNVGQRANLYRVINRLHEAGLIVVRQTQKDHQFPERTVYELTEAGHQTSREWLSTMLSSHHNEFPEFPAALSFVMLMGPEESLRLLEQRAESLRQEIARLDGELGTYAPVLPRVTLLETEYVRALARAELAWLDGITDELRSGALTWSYEELAAFIVADDPLRAAVEAGGTGPLPSRT